MNHVNGLVLEFGYATIICENPKSTEMLGSWVRVIFRLIVNSLTQSSRVEPATEYLKESDLALDLQNLCAFNTQVTVRV